VSGTDHDDFSAFAAYGNVDISGGGSGRPEAPRRVRAEDGGDWRTVAPRWVLLTVIMALFSVVGALGALVASAKSEHDQRVEDAIKDTPSKYQSRLAERQAVSEIKIATLEANYLRLTIALEKQTEATNLQTVQLERLNNRLDHAPGRSGVKQ